MIKWSWLPDNKLHYTEFPEFKLDELRIDSPDYGTNINNFMYNPEDDNIRAETVHTLFLEFDQEKSSCGFTSSPSDPNLLSKLCLHFGDSHATTLEVVDLDKDEIVSVTPNFTGVSKWSPDGQEILFIKRSNGETPNFFIWDRDTKEVKQVTHISKEFDFYDPAWSFDKHWIAFHKKSDVTEEVCFMAVGTGKMVCIPGYVFPVGDKISWASNNQAFVISARSSNKNVSTEANDLYIISVPDGEITQITNDPSQNELTPIWAK